MTKASKLSAAANKLNGVVGMHRALLEVYKSELKVIQAKYDKAETLMLESESNSDKRVKEIHQATKFAVNELTAVIETMTGVVAVMDTFDPVAWVGGITRARDEIRATKSKIFKGKNK